jgi:pimeloyl-ACP methyl ester carboxylesterase
VGATIVLLHGLATSAEIWEQQVNVLEGAGWHAIAVDLRGHGESPGDSGQWSIPDLAADVLATIDGFGISRFGLIGHSLGGRVMWSLALKQPDRVDFLVSVGAQSEAPSGQYREAMYAWRAALSEGGLGPFAELFAADGEVPERIARDKDYAKSFWDRFGRNRPGALVACIDAILSMPSYTFELSTLHCPVLALVGAGDVNFLSAAVQYDARISTAKVVEIPACGHYPMIDQPESFNGSVLEFLREVTLDAPRCPGA